MFPDKRPVTMAAAALAAAAAVLSGCGADSEAASTAGVPDGVAEQYETLSQEVADRGGRSTSGDWTISYIVEAAESWFEEHGGHGTFREPQEGETHHLEIIPTEAATGRIVPDVPITLEVVDDDGKVVDEQPLEFYHSTFFHYANNFHVPEAGTYTLRATLGSPGFRRHGDESDGPALDEGVTVEFADVDFVAP